MKLVCKNCSVSKEFKNITKSFTWQCSKCMITNEYIMKEKKKKKIKKYKPVKPELVVNNLED